MVQFDGVFGAGPLLGVVSPLTDLAGLGTFLVGLCLKTVLQGFWDFSASGFGAFVGLEGEVDHHPELASDTVRKIVGFTSLYFAYTIQGTSSVVRMDILAFETLVC